MIMKKLSMRGHTKENIKYHDEFQALIDNKLKNVFLSLSLLNP